MSEFHKWYSVSKNLFESRTPADSIVPMLEDDDDLILPDDSEFSMEEPEGTRPAPEDDGTEAFNLLYDIEEAQDRGFSAAEKTYSIDKLRDMPIEVIRNIHAIVMGLDEIDSSEGSDTPTDSEDQAEEVSVEEASEEFSEEIDLDNIDFSVRDTLSESVKGLKNA